LRILDKNYTCKKNQENCKG